MIYCSSCAKKISRPDNVDGKICCPLCGRVVDEDNFSQETTFIKNAAGQSQMSGTNLNTMENECSVSRQRTLNEASDEIRSIMLALHIDGERSILNPATRFYEIAVERNFTRGRRKEQVAAACLYIACREAEKPKPFLLIDFSQHLRINVYVLGAVFLQLCKLLSLDEHPIVRKFMDPSLFMHRFTHRLFGENREVTNTALRIIASMKRDWMQTGRKPSGLCGAALYISALSHGLKCSKPEIIKVVHVCEATLTRRLTEFENTESGSLTIDEFNEKAKEYAKEDMLTDTFNKLSKKDELLCQHKDSQTPHFAHGLCQSCYNEVIQLLGGYDGGSEPPAFQRAERERIMANEENVEDPFILPSTAQHKGKTVDEPENTMNVIENKKLPPAVSDLAGATLQDKTKHDSSNDDKIDPVDATFEESESLSDIDDTEVDWYLHSEEEKKFKKIIWEEMNKEYLEEQAVKEAAALAAKKAYEASFSNCSEDVKAAQKLAAEAAAAVAKSKKARQEKRAAEMKNIGPAQTAAEATRQMLDRKRLSSKIRYDVLEKLFDDSDISKNTKRSRTEAEKNHDDNYLEISKEDSVVESAEVALYQNVEEYEDDGHNYFDDFQEFR